MIQVRDLLFRYGDSFQLTLKHLDVKTREHVAVVGRSGCGKTTLLNILAGVQSPVSGEVHVNGIRVDRLDDAQRRRFRAKHVGFVFQEFELIDYLNVSDNILLPFDVGVGGRRPSDVRERLAHLLSATSLSDRGGHYPRQLSQGQRQRAALCRALITQPELILADEPTGSLDKCSSEAVLDLMFEQLARLNATLVMVTHDSSLLDRFDRVVELDEDSGQA